MFGSRRNRKGGDIACIFVHAGAGFHSVQNEHTHLGACNDAAKAAMAVMKNGGTAVDAVEIAVKILEDREITNAGYGSNLTADGTVECDAVVVDHLGRSGGAGAVTQIKNPVSLARLILDHATQTLSLRRVPPNFLAGQGATDFAYEHDMPVVSYDSVISPGARERWSRWNVDLQKAELNRKREEADRYGFSPPPSQASPPSFPALGPGETEIHRREHVKAMMASTWNEAQPISPPPSDNREPRTDSSSSSHRSSTSSVMISQESPDSFGPNESTDPYGPPGMLEFSSRSAFANSTQKAIYSTAFNDAARYSGADGGMYLQRQYPSEMDLSNAGEQDQHLLPTRDHGQDPRVRPRHDGSSGSDSDSTTVEFNGRSRFQRRTAFQTHCAFDGEMNAEMPEAPPISSTPEHEAHFNYERNLPPLPSHPFPTDASSQREDLITDTVGAIAIDSYGNIACGASSGGIGMKHRGRIGPAALVGIGAAVQPIDEKDIERTTVATVTSGTGEHMATTTAAGVCTERVYQGIRKVPGGRYEECGDDEAIKGFIDRDFMGHPSVVNSTSSGAIGMLTVKKTIDGMYLYFGHNTDSFALASMHSDETKPVCTMSRSKGNGSVAQGGRAIRYRRKKP